MPVVVYQLGPQSVPSGGSHTHQQHHVTRQLQNMTKTGGAICSVFEFTPLDEPIGSVFLVTDARPAVAPSIDGPFGARRLCARYATTELPHKSVLASMLATVPSADQSHPVRIAGLAIAKLELLRHLPTTLGKVALLDADTYCVRGCGAKLAGQVPGAAEPSSRAHFISASRSGMRSWGGGHQLQVRFDGINSGVLVLNLTRFRLFVAAYCAEWPVYEWHRCVVQRAPAGTNWRMSDQAVWNTLITNHSSLYRPLPCGFHAEGEVLSGLGACMELGRRFAERHPADDCRPSTRVVAGYVGADGVFGLPPRWPLPPVALVHGAAGRKVLARAIAQRLMLAGGREGGGRRECSV